MLTIQSHDVGPVTLLRLAGRLAQEAGVAALKTELDRLAEAGRHRAVLDLNLVTWIDSVGLGLLAAKYVSFQRHEGRLTLLHVTPRSMHLLATTKLTSIFDVHTSEEAAVLACTG